MPPRRATRDERPVRRRSADADDVREPYDEEDLPEEEAEEELEQAGTSESRPEDDGARGSRGGTGNRRGDSGGRPASGSGGVPAAQAAQSGMRSLVELTGKKPEGLTAVEPTDDGWVIGVEVIEDQRVPSSADILAVYEAELDPDGNLMSYRRTARYARGRGDSPRDS